MKRDGATTYARGAGRLSSSCIVTLPRFIGRSNAIKVSQAPAKIRLIDIVLALMDNRIPILVLHVLGNLDDIALLLCRQ